MFRVRCVYACVGVRACVFVCVSVCERRVGVWFSEVNKIGRLSL